MDELVPEAIGPKYALRIHDLRNWHVLQVTCWKCGHLSLVYPSRLRQRWSGYERLMDIERKFRCTKCGNRHDNAWQVFRLPRNT